MNIDDKIKEFGELSVAESKKCLAEYAMTEYNIKLNRQRSFENMVTDLKGELVKNGHDVVIESKKPEIEIPHTENIESIESTKPVETVEIKTDELPVESDTKTPIQDMPLKEPVANSESTTDESILPDGFSPTIILMGSGRGYFTCPWWIYDWIAKTPDWKHKIDSCPHYGSSSILQSMIYYINRDGSIMIRETRNSKFVEIK